MSMERDEQKTDTSQDDANIAGASGDSGRERRLAALRALAGRHDPTPVTPNAQPRSPTLLASRPRARRPAWHIISAAALALCVVAVGIFAALRLRQPAHHPLTPDPLVVPISRAGMRCVKAASWSPDGRRIAALMTPDICDHAVEGTYLVLYDAALAHVLNTINLDQAILPQALPQSVQQDPALMKQTGVAYYSMRWSPDGAQVGVLAGGPVPTPTAGDGSPDAGYFWALALVDLVNGSNASVRVIATPPQSPTQFTGDNSSYNPDSYRPVLAWRFDLLASAVTLASIPQALAYTWGADGALTPAVPLPTSNDTPAYFMSGAAPWRSFSIYQTVEPCGIEIYQVMLSASLWSPDGRFVVPMLFAHGRLDPSPFAAPTPTLADGGGDTGACTPQDQANAEWDRANLAPLQTPPAVATALGQITTPDNTPIALMGQLNPTGIRLVVQAPGVPYIPWVARVYDTATGALRATITWKQLGVNANLSTAPCVGMAWSPDGTHLLLSDDHAFYLLGALGG